MEADLSGDRWFIVTDQDQRGTILVIAIICCVYCPMILALRAVTKFQNLGLDDLLAVASTVTGIIQYAIVFAAVSHGLGETFDEVSSEDANQLGSLTIASEIFFFITICLTKCSVVILCRKLFGIGAKKHKIYCDVATGICVIWALASILAVAVGCGPSQQIAFRTPYCPRLGTRWTGVAVADAVTELIIFLLSIAVVFPLQMSIRRKVTVVMSFLPRIGIIIFISLHAQSVNQMVQSSTPGTGLTKPTVYLQIQLIYAITAAAIPALNRSLRLFNTSMGASWWSSTLSASNGKSGLCQSRGRGDIPLASLKSSKNRSRARSPERNEATGSENARNLRPDPVEYNFTSISGAETGEADARSGRSHDSTDSKSRIIRKDTHWHVRYDGSNK